MLDLLLDRVVLLVSTLLGLINISGAIICETRRVHLIVAAVVLVDRPLLPCDPELGKD
jgi:hypothetical protein